METFGKNEILFPSQQPNERVVIAVREHWFVIGVKFFIIFLLSLLPWIFRLLLIDTQIIQADTFVLNIIQIATAIFYLVLLIAAFVIYVLYYLNLHVVSEERIVDIDQVGLLSREVSELNIETIEDVSSKTSGLFGNILNFGNVSIQTAGAVDKFHFENVPNPESISKVILQLYEAHSDSGQKEEPKP